MISPPIRRALPIDVAFSEILLEQTKLLDAEFKYLIIFFNLSKINFAKLKQK